MILPWQTLLLLLLTLLFFSSSLNALAEPNEQGGTTKHSLPRIGDHVYDKPLSDYPVAIVSALRLQPNPGASASKLSEWYLEVAIAHRNVAESMDMRPEAIPEHLTLAFNAFRQALQSFQQRDDEGWEYQFDLAGLYFQMGETYTLQHTIDGDRNPKALQHATDYLVQSQTLYNAILSRNEKLPQHQLHQLKAAVSIAELRLGSVYLTDAMGITADDAKFVSLLQLELQDRVAPVLEKQLQNNWMGSGTISMEWVYENLISLTPLHFSPAEALQWAKNTRRKEQQTVKAVEILTRASEVMTEIVEKWAHPSEKRTFQKHLASTLQSLGTAHTMVHRQEKEGEVKKKKPKQKENDGSSDIREDLPFHQQKALDSLERALTILRELTQHTTSIPNENEEISLMAETLFSLSDSYLEMGRYTESTERYQEAMTLYASNNKVAMHQRDVATIVGGMFREGTVDDETIKQYEAVLEEYREKILNDPTTGNVPLNGEHLAEGEGVYHKNDYFEGDIHMTLGTLYMSTSADYVQAESHFRQAIQLYQLSSDIQTIKAMADCRYNLASLLFQMKKYDDSAETRKMALDAYREIVGEGVDPLSTGAGGEIDMQQSQDMDLSVIVRRIFATYSMEGTGSDSTADEQPYRTTHQQSITTTGDYETLINLADFEESEFNETSQES